MPPGRSTTAAAVGSTNAAPLTDIAPADVDRFVRHLAEAAASWHRRRAAPVPIRSADRHDLPRAA